MRLRRRTITITCLGGAIALGTACSSDDFGTPTGDESFDTGSGGDYGSSTGAGGSYGTGGSVGPSPIPGEEEPDPVPACEQLDDSTPLVLYLSADDSNSMASAAIAREQIADGGPIDVRTHELLNYYRIGYEAAPPGELSIIPQMEPGDESGHFDLQIGVRAFDAQLPRRPMTLTFVLDTSGSMGGEPLAREKAAVEAIAKNLSDGDIVNMVTWSTGQNVVLDGHVVEGPDDAALLSAAQNLTANGGTDLESGLETGYDLATEHYGPGRLNRVILVSDGGANVGVTSADLIAEHSADSDQEGIYLVGIGTGPVEQYQDGLMDVVTDEGRGAYVYLDSTGEAVDVFGDRFDEVMEVAARAVEVELTLPWYFQMHQFSGEEYSEDPEEVDPQHLAPNDAMVFHQVLKACDESVVDPTDEISIAVDWVEPITYEPQSTSVTTTLDTLLDGPTAQLLKGKAIVAYGEALRSGTPEDLADAYAAAEAAGIFDDPELEEIAALLQSHPSFPDSN